MTGMNYIYSFPDCKNSYVHHAAACSCAPNDLKLRPCAVSLSIDPGILGNLGRFFNHSCEPNIIQKQVQWLPVQGVSGSIQ